MVADWGWGVGSTISNEPAQLPAQLKQANARSWQTCAHVTKRRCAVRRVDQAGFMVGLSIAGIRLAI